VEILAIVKALPQTAQRHSDRRAPTVPQCLALALMVSSSSSAQHGANGLEKRFERGRRNRFREMMIKACGRRLEPVLILSIASDCNENGALSPNGRADLARPDSRI
jgi:hypothetical protein